MKTNLTAAFAALALGAGAFGGAASAANVLANGSFESPTCTSGYCNFGIGGDHPGSTTAITGWTITTNNVDIVQSNAGWGAAQDGAHMLDLVGYGSTGAIQQTFATTAGKTYEVSFYYANNPYPAGADTAAVTVTGAGSLLTSSVTHTDSTASNMDWNHFTGSFVADSSSATLAFNETQGGGNAGVFLDNVSVSVPEPATWSLMIMGVGAVGASLRNRRRRAIPA
jgi:choice-of-anchor C domain-containing protein